MIEFTDDEAAELRRLAQRILDLIPDPTAAVHAREDVGGDPIPLCGIAGRSRLTSDPQLVTCQRCLLSPDFDAWCWQRTDGGDL